MTRILIIDDDPTCCNMLTRLLAHEGYDVASSPDGEDVDRAEEPDLLICDWILKDKKSGLDVSRSLTSRWPKISTLFITGLPTENLAEEIRGINVVGFLEKPLMFDQLLATIANSAGSGKGLEKRVVS